MRCSFYHPTPSHGCGVGTDSVSRRRQLKDRMKKARGCSYLFLGNHADVDGASPLSRLRGFFALWAGGLLPAWLPLPQLWVSVAAPNRPLSPGTTRSPFPRVHFEFWSAIIWFLL
jgi:hypothetical protein